MARSRPQVAGYQAVQVQTHTITVRKMMGSRDFVDGFNDARKGVPFDYATKRDNQWSYERGRLLACVFDGALKEGRIVTNYAIHAYMDARKAGYIL